MGLVVAAAPETLFFGDGIGQQAAGPETENGLFDSLLLATFAAGGQTLSLAGGQPGISSLPGRYEPAFHAGNRPQGKSKPEGELPGLVAELVFAATNLLGPGLLKKGEAEPASSEILIVSQATALPADEPEPATPAILLPMALPALALVAEAPVVTGDPAAETGSTPVAPAAILDLAAETVTVSEAAPAAPEQPAAPASASVETTPRPVEEAAPPAELPAGPAIVTFAVQAPGPAAETEPQVAPIPTAEPGEPVGPVGEQPVRERPELREAPPGESQAQPVAFSVVRSAGNANNNENPGQGQGQGRRDLPVERPRPNASAQGIAHAAEGSAVAQLRETPAPAEIQPIQEPVPVLPPSVEQVATAVVERVEAGGGEARLHLNPEHLGEVVIRVETRGDAVEVYVHAERPEAMQLLREATDQLATLLGERGLTLGNLFVNLGQREAFGFGRPEGEPRRRNRAGEDDFASILGIEDSDAVERHNRLRATYNPDGAHLFRV